MLKNWVLLFCFTILIVKNTNSCSCAGYGDIDKEQVNSYDFIARGIVVKNDQYLYDLHVTFDFLVLELFKGKLKDSIIQINTNTSSESCGLGTTVGAEYLMFANTSGAYLETSLCSRSAEIQIMPDTLNFIGVPKGYWKNEFNAQVNKDLAFLREMNSN